MNPSVEIFSQGEEVVTGQVVDSNAAWLSQQLVAMGFRVQRHSAVGDSLGALVGLLQEIAERADCCICTGGLGPTVDDLTTAAVAEAFALALVLDELALAQIEAYFARRQRPMADINRKQAYLPQSALRLDNHWGTAPGFTLQHGRCRFVFLPGVPSEMKPMFDASVRSLLQQQFVLQPEQLVMIRSIGIGESDIQQALQVVKLPDNVQLGFRASIDEVQTKLLFPAQYDLRALRELVGCVARQIGDYVFAIDGIDGDSGDLIAVVSQLMRQHHLTLAVLENANCGLLAAKCLGCDWLLAAQFDPQLSQHISAGDVEALARQYQLQSGADAVLLQWYQSDDLKQNQAIALQQLLLLDGVSVPSSHILAGTAQRKQNQAALLGLDKLRRVILKR